MIGSIVLERFTARQDCARWRKIVSECGSPRLVSSRLVSSRAAAPNALATTCRRLRGTHSALRHQLAHEVSQPQIARVEIVVRVPENVHSDGRHLDGETKPNHVQRAAQPHGELRGDGQQVVGRFCEAKGRDIAPAANRNLAFDAKLRERKVLHDRAGRLRGDDEVPGLAVLLQGQRAARSS